MGKREREKEREREREREDRMSNIKKSSARYDSLSHFGFVS